MQFVKDGPDIPDALLQAQAEGRLVFFCGAGISRNAGLPDFKNLVEELYKFLGTGQTATEKLAFEKGNFDEVLNLLEKRFPAGREAVRKVLPQILKLNYSSKHNTDMHSALLELARHSDGKLRLVTTNFDRIFEKVAKKNKNSFQAHIAPALPIPKNKRWQGLVYLHGLLPSKQRSLEDSRLDHLVLTSGDFGQAYLSEGWATRFVIELFRNYVVCFVGYSINDVMIKYILDALAADQMQGEKTEPVYALFPSSSSDGKDKTDEWQTKSITPIRYRDHSHLPQTFKAWSKAHQDGITSKEHIVVNYALTKPFTSTPQDDFVGRMLWALSDETGLPAKHFAELNPVPTLEWLFDERFEQKLLSEWGNQVKFHIFSWLVRHIHDWRLLMWVAQNSRLLPDHLTKLIDNKLNEFASKQRQRKDTELDKIRLHAPTAIPSSLIRTCWELLRIGRVKSSPSQAPDVYGWIQRLKREGLTTTLRFELRELLTPKVILKQCFPRGKDDSSSTDEPTRIEQLVPWNLELATNDLRWVMDHLANNEHWMSALPQLPDDLQQLLRDTLDLSRELGEANLSVYWALPSITPHWQNRRYCDWVSLIELLRDAWLAVRTHDNLRATRIAQTWFELPYSLFKRLALFAASQDGCIPHEQWVDWLLAEDARWLWCKDTMREKFRLLVLQGKQLTEATQQRLEAAILDGPPRNMYPKDLESARWQELVDHSVWLHLAKLRESGVVLSELGSARFAEISNANPKLELAAHERDEFAHWSSGSRDPDYEDNRDVDIAPRKREELVKWLLRKPEPERLLPFYEDKWGDVCETRFFHSLSALCDLTREGFWPPNRWRKALQVWAKESLISRSWQYAALLVLKMPDSVLQEISHAVTWWIEAISKSINRDENILLELCRRILELTIDSCTEKRCTGKPIHQPVIEAINHPIGHVTQALINLWLKQNINDKDPRPADIKPLLTQLCDVQTHSFRHGRVLLGSQLNAFFRVDPSWTKQYLLPLFDWDNSAEPQMVWEGFLCSARPVQPLWAALKSQFLKTAHHYVDLSEHRQEYAALLTYLALDLNEGDIMDEFQSSMEVLPPEGLEYCAQALYQAIESSSNQSENYWKNRIQPFWKKAWPKHRRLATPRIAESLTRVAIAAKGQFPAALDAVQGWLQPIEHPYYVVSLLHESDLSKRFPEQVLQLLSLVIDDPQWAPQELGLCLDEIIQAAPNLRQDRRYSNLHYYFQIKKSN